jgi:hypothetical protein
MADPFSQPQRRIARAKEHIDELDEGIKLLLAKHPYTVLVETDPKTGNKVHKLKLTESIPPRLRSIAIETAEGLRSALDGFGFASAFLSGNRRLKGTYFPIADTDAKIDTDIIGRGRCKDIPDEILSIFRSFQPYKAGNPLIWGVNQVANGTKHRALIPIGFMIDRTFIESFKSPGLTIRVDFPPIWDSENDEMVLCVVAPDNKPQYNMRFNMLICLSEVYGIFRDPAPRVLRTMAAEVERILMATEAECRRLGWLPAQ